MIRWIVKLSKMLIIYQNWSMWTSMALRRMQIYSRVSGSFELETVTLKRNWSIRAQTSHSHWRLWYSLLADSVMVQMIGHVLGVLFCHVMTCKKDQAFSVSLSGCILTQI